jgi:hypothetical protein
MKLGAENRSKLILAGVLFVVAVMLLVRMFSSGGQPASAATAIPAKVEPPPTASTRAGRVRSRPGAAAKTPQGGSAISLDPRLRLDLLKQSEETEYKGAGRNIFRAEAEPVIPKPVAPPVKPPPPAPVIYTPPPPPPINLKFFGFANSPDEPAQVFLSQGDEVFVAREGQIVNRRYKVLKINPKSVEIEDVLGNNRQTIPLTQG